MYFSPKGRGQDEAFHVSFASFSFRKEKEVGVHYDEVPPVPIPNTAVKLICAENTWREAAWEDRSSPTPAARAKNALAATYSSIAQLVEHAAVNRRVVGSSPTWGAKAACRQNDGKPLFQEISLNGLGL